MKSTRLFAAMLVGMVAAMGAAAQATMRVGSGMKPQIKPPKTAEPSRTVGSSRNGGRRSSNRAHQRLVAKRHNQHRNRLAHRG